MKVLLYSFVVAIVSAAIVLCGGFYLFGSVSEEVIPFSVQWLNWNNNLERISVLQIAGIAASIFGPLTAVIMSCRQ